MEAKYYDNEEYLRHTNELEIEYTKRKNPELYISFQGSFYYRNVELLKYGMGSEEFSLFFHENLTLTYNITM